MLLQEANYVDSIARQTPAIGKDIANKDGENAGVNRAVCNRFI